MMQASHNPEKQDEVIYPLLENIQAGYLEGVQACLAQGDDPTGVRGVNLIAAMIGGHTAIAECLLNAGADISRNLNESTFTIYFKDSTPELTEKVIASLAAHTDQNNYQQISHHLENLKYIKSRVETKRIIAQYENAVLQRFNDGLIKSYHIAKKLRVKINHVVNQQFLGAAASNNFDKMKELSTIPGVYLDYEMDISNTFNVGEKFDALFWAVHYDRADIVEWFAANASDHTTLFTCTLYWKAINQPCIADKLLDVIAANTTERNFDGTLSQLKDNSYDLTDAARSQYFTKLLSLPTSKELLNRIHEQQNYDAQVNLNYRLLCSVRDQEVALARKHLELGANPNSWIPGFHYHTALNQALYNNQFSMIHLLLSFKANPNIALKYAVEKSDTALTGLVLTFKPDLKETVYDDFRHVPLLTFALRRSNTAIVKQLISAIARVSTDDDYEKALEAIENYDSADSKLLSMYFLEQLMASDESDLSRFGYQLKRLYWLKKIEIAKDYIRSRDFNGLVASFSNGNKPLTLRDKEYFINCLNFCVETHDDEAFAILLKLIKDKNILSEIINLTINVIDKKLDSDLSQNYLVVFFIMLENQQAVTLTPEDCMAVANCIKNNFTASERKALKVEITSALNTTLQPDALRICENIVANSKNSLLAKIFRIKQSETGRDCDISRGSLKDINTLLKKLRKQAPVAAAQQATILIPAAAIAPELAPDMNEMERSPRNSGIFNLFASEPSPAEDQGHEMRDLSHSNRGSRRDSQC